MSDLANSSNLASKSAVSSLMQIRGAGVQIESVPLLNDINLDIHGGQVLAIVGPNGAGKSTLIRTMCGEQSLTTGSILLDQNALLDWSTESLAKRMAVLPQRSLLEFPFTSREVIELARTPHSSGVAQDQKIVDEVLEYMDVTHLADRLYTRLSGGEQQRVQLARVLAQIWQPLDGPCILLLDEPSSYFDLAHQELLIKLVREFAERDVAIAVVLHDLNLAISCADMIAVLCCGRLHAHGVPENVLTPQCIQEVFGVEASFIRDEATGRKYLVHQQPKNNPVTG